MSLDDVTTGLLDFAAKASIKALEVYTHPYTAMFFGGFCASAAISKLQDSDYVQAGFYFTSAVASGVYVSVRDRILSPDEQTDPKTV